MTSRRITELITTKARRLGKSTLKANAAVVGSTSMGEAPRERPQLPR